MALALVLTMSRSGAIGLLVAIVIAGGFVTRGQSTALRRIVLAAFLVFMGAFVIWGVGVDRLAARFNETDSVGAAGRLGIWADTWHIARRFPLAGTGLNTFGTATIFYQTADRSLHFAQAHNDYLQLLSEGGFLLVVPAAILLLVIIWRIVGRVREPLTDADYWIRVGAVTGIVAIAFQEAVDFSLQMPGNAVLFVVLLALASRRSRVNTAS
jgi:O-antigen ligase